MDQPILNPGKVKCLGGCDKMFDSRDKATNRICPTCSKRNAKERIPRVIASRIEIDGHTFILEPEE